MAFTFGKASRSRMMGVHPQLIALFKKVIAASDDDFGIVSGVRTVAEQREKVRLGYSHTMHSYHLPQSDGYGHAMDFAPWVNAALSFDTGKIGLARFKRIGMLFEKTAKDMGIKIVWGGRWGWDWGHIEYRGELPRGELAKAA